MKNIILIIFISVLYGGKPKGYENNKFFTLSQIYTRAYNLKIIEKDPILVIDDKSYGFLSKIDTTDIKFKGLEKSSINVIPKNNDCLEKYFGKDSQNGIISIKKHLLMICDGRTRNSIFICDNKLTSLQEMIKNKNTKYYSVGYFSNALDSDGISTEISILTTNKIVSNKIKKLFPIQSQPFK